MPVSGSSGDVISNPVTTVQVTAAARRSASVRFRPPTPGQYSAATEVALDEDVGVAGDEDLLRATRVGCRLAERLVERTEALAELKAGKPSIPRDIDKALLTDLSDRRGEFDCRSDTALAEVTA